VRATKVVNAGDGVDRIFSTSMGMEWLRTERPSVSTLTYSIDTLLFSIIAMCLRYVGEPVDVRAGLLSKKHVEAIINSVWLPCEEGVKLPHLSEDEPYTDQLRNRALRGRGI
jgi:hypothetical protein